MRSLVMLSSPSAILIGLSVVFVGAVIQGAIGFGINMVAAPVLAVAAPDAVPATVVLVSFPLCILAVAREHHALDRKALPWLFLGVVPGSLTGLGLLAVVDNHALAVLVGAITLAGVGLSLLDVRVRIGRWSALVAGTTANVFGTAAGTSAAPVALLYQHERGERTRATLGAFFAASALTSLIGYLAIGKLDVDQGLFALILIPAMIVGMLMSRLLHRHLEGPWLRPSVLGLTAAAGVVALVHGLS